MVRRGKYTKGGKKASYLNEDNKRYHTLKILKKGTAMTQTRLMDQQQLLTSQWRGFETILNDLVEWEWIENVDSPVGNANLFGITKKGRSIYDALQTLFDTPEISKELKNFKIFAERPLDYRQTSTD